MTFKVTHTQAEKKPRVSYIMHASLPAKIGDVCTAVAGSESCHLSQVTARVHSDLLQVDGQQTVAPFHCTHTNKKIWGSSWETTNFHTLNSLD